MFKKTINKQALVLEKKINFVKKKVLLLAYSIMYTKVYTYQTIDMISDVLMHLIFEMWSQKLGGFELSTYYNK